MFSSSTTTMLPAITKLEDCANYAKTFKPYLPQLYELPQQIAAHITDPHGLKELYLATNPAMSALAFAISLFPVFLVVSEINKNYSQVDRVWSILPMLFNAHYAIWARLNGMPTQKLDNILAISVVWSGRLTFNYWRKGGYQVGSEDYRWELIKKYVGQPAFFLLNVFFIASMQSVVLWGVTTPTYIQLLVSRIQPDMAWSDIVFSRVLMGLIVLTWFADQQQWDFYQAREQYRKTAKVPSGWTRAQMDRGFNTTGLWRYSRHPNFAAEQSVWFVLYQWACYSTETLYNWTFYGVLAYVMVFQGSTPITEAISSSKYPEYKVYQERVGRFLPSLLGAGWDEEEMEKAGGRIAEEQDKKDAKKVKGKVVNTVKELRK